MQYFTASNISSQLIMHELISQVESWFLPSFYDVDLAVMAMNRLKNSGFYKLKFLITPEEFRHMLNLFEQKQAQFNCTNYARTKHDQSQVYETYERFYQYYRIAPSH